MIAMLALHKINDRWHWMECRWDHFRAIMMFKIINKLVAISTEAILSSSTSNTRSYSKRFRQLPTTIECYLHSFFPASIRIWNNLPDPLVNETDLQRFKVRISNFHFNYNYIYYINWKEMYDITLFEACTLIIIIIIITYSKNFGGKNFGESQEFANFFTNFPVFVAWGVHSNMSCALYCFAQESR